MDIEVYEEEIILELTAEPVIEIEVRDEPIIIEIGDGRPAFWGGITGDIRNQTDLQDALAGKSDVGHVHDDRYYTKSGTDIRLSVKSDVGHVHDNRYYTEGETDIKLAGKSDVGHVHDNRYYTEGETDIKLAGKSDVGHVHDDRYYTVSEVNSLLSGKSNIDHDHDGRYYTEEETDTLLSGKSDTGHTHTYIEDDENNNWHVHLNTRTSVNSSSWFACVEVDTNDNNTRRVRSISAANLRKSLGTALPLFKTKTANLGNVTIASDGWQSLQTAPSAPSGYQLLFATVIEGSIHGGGSYSITGDGKYALGKQGETISGLKIRYYYCLSGETIWDV